MSCGSGRKGGGRMDLGGGESKSDKDDRGGGGNNSGGGAGRSFTAADANVGDGERDPGELYTNTPIICFHIKCE